MRTVLRIVFSRYGIVAIILLLVVGALALSQGREDFPLGSGGSDEVSASPESPSEELTADDGVVAPECEGEECEAGDSPLHDPYEEVELPEEAVEKALAFAEAWVDTAGKDAYSWFQGMQPYMTEKTAEFMRGVDPASVPATAVVGGPEVDGDKVRVPMDTGVLVVPMIEGSNGWAEEGWLVASFDWEPS